MEEILRYLAGNLDKGLWSQCKIQPEFGQGLEVIEAVVLVNEFDSQQVVELVVVVSARFGRKHGERSVETEISKLVNTRGCFKVGCL